MREVIENENKGRIAGLPGCNGGIFNRRKMETAYSAQSEIAPVEIQRTSTGFGRNFAKGAYRQPAADD